jgi:ABC-2 type transport system ATP-binding protein
MMIETHGLSKEYRNAVAIDSLELAVPEGRISAFLGPNGSGKTTTIKILLGLARPTAGEAFVFDKPVTEESSSLEIRQRVGYVSEDKRLYPYMTGEQILDFTRPLFSRWSREREQRLVAAFNLPLYQKVKTFSKGMRSKLALILALARQPDLLILDEPSEGLDPVAGEHMLQAIVESAAQGCTVFFSSHQISEVERIADEVFIMCGGRLALHGPLEELRENFRRMHFAFIGRAPIEEMSLEGVRTSRADGHVLSLVVDSNVDNITGRARALGAISVDVQPMSLRELFLDAVETGAEDH